MSHQSQQRHYNTQEQKKDLQRKGEEAVKAFTNFLQKNSPPTPHLIILLVVVPLAAFLLVVSVLSFMGSLFGLVLATPVFVFFSPVIVPAVLAIGGSVVGLFVSGAFGITGLSALSWIINFIRYRVSAVGGVGAGDVVQRAQETVGYVGQKVKEMGQDVGYKAHQVSRS
ncbi:hypothetical protein vseg_003154 [Gypsophila vaccaria]